MSNSDAYSTGGLPLADVTVLDLTQVVAGPFATMTLGDLGAEVIKVEAPGRGDRSRSIRPIPEYFDTINRNKHSIAVDLKSQEGQAVVHDLADEADVLIESMKPGRAKAFNFAYDDITATNPGIIYCSISGFGSDSPYADVPAWDMLIQAMSGIMSMTGERDGPPLWSGLVSGDLSAAMYTVQSVIAALYARERGLIDGEYIEIPMLDAAISWLSSRAGHTFGTGEPFPRFGTYHPSVAPFGEFEAADGPIVIAAGTDSLWQDLCTALDRPELASDDRFATMDARIEHREALRNEIEPLIGDMPGQAVVERCHEQGVPAGPIYDTKTVWEDEHVRQHDLHKVMERPDREDADVIDHPVDFTNLEAALRDPPEQLGESTDDLLARVGYDTTDIEQLRADGVVD